LECVVVNPSARFHPRQRSARIRTFGERVEDFLRYLAATLFGLTAFLFLVGIPVLLAVTSTHGLGSGIKRRAEQLLGGANYEVHLDRVLFSPFRGFVLEGVQFHDRTASRRPVVSANRVAVSPNMDSLLRGRPLLDRISLSDASLDIPLGNTPEPRLRLDRVNAQILCPPGQLRINQASFVIAGIHVSVTGTFLNPKAFAPKPVAGDGPGNTAKTIQGIQKILREVAWTGGQPLLSIDAGGDLSDTESLRVSKADFHAGSGVWRGVPFRGIMAGITYADRMLRLDKFLFEDGGGSLQAVGNADFRSNSASLEITGGIDPAPVLRLFPGTLGGEWIFSEPLSLNAALGADWSAGKPSLGGTALFSLQHASFRAIRVDSLSAGIAFRDGKLLVRDFALGGDFGSVAADLMIAPGDNRIRLDASVFPGKLAPLAGGQTREALSAMDFREPLRIRFGGGMPGRDPLELKGSGSLSLGKGAMRGAWIEGLSANVEVSGGAADFRDILVRIGGGTGRGEFIYDYRNWEGRFPEIRTTLDPVKVMTWIDPRIAEGLKPYRFVTPPETRLTGKVGLKNPEKNDLRIAVSAPGGMDYNLIGKDLSFGVTSGTVLLKGQKLLIDIPSARLLGGGVSFKGDVSVVPGDGRYGASVHLDRVDFRELTKLYFGYGESGGSLTADYAFRTVGGDDLAMTGKGNLLIQDGNVLAMPVLGPLSLLMGEVIPGLGYQTAREATADFSVEGGVITTRDLLIKGKGFSMIGNGRIHYLEDKMEMNIRLNAQGLPGVVLFPVSKIFEYESVGSAKHPKWRPKLLPKIGGAQTSPASQSSPTPTP
jgi:hypothetical protein